MTSVLLSGFLVTLLIACLFQTVMFFIAQKIGRDDLVDVGWGIGFIVIAFYWALVGETTMASIITVLLVTIWGTRLAYHILSRFVQKEEDRRYVSMKRGWKYPRLRSYFQIFILQGFLMSIIALPIMTVHLATVGETIIAIAFGFAVWFMGFVFQVTGDLELTKHIASKNEGLLTTGIWSYTRHPNYFGEMMMWWGIFFIVSSNISVYGFFVALLGPIVITLLLRFVSGVPMLEKHWAEKYGDDFVRYKKEVPMLVPKLRR